MPDLTKNVEIALKIVGANDKTLTSLVGAFEKIQKAVNNTTTFIDKFKKSLDSIKVPSGMSSIITAFKQLNGIKFSNLNQIAIGFEKLKAIGIPIDLKPFASELKKLSGITLPNLAQIGSGLEKIIKTPLSALAMKVGTLVTQLSRLKEIGTLPNLNRVANGLVKLVKTPLGPLAMKVGSLETQLGRLAKIGALPNLGQIATGLTKILKTPLSGFAAKITSIETHLKRLSNIDLTTLASVLKNISKINLSKVADQLNKTEKAIRETGAASQTTGLQLGTLMGKIKTVTTFRIIAEGFNMLRNAITGGIDAIIEYDQALKDLQAITGATNLEVSQMGDKIIEVATKTKFSASEVAEGMRIIGQAGFSSSEAIQTMQSVSDLATGTLSTMATSVDLVTTAMRVFDIDASNSQKVVDVFANAVNKSKLTIDKLRTAMNYVGPIAKSAGVSFQELSAAMGTLANSGLRASTIGTGLRRIFAELVSPSKKLAAAAKEAGVSLNELDPTSNSLSSVLSNLNLVISDSGVAFDIFGKRGAAAVLALTDHASGFNSMLDTVSKSGTAARMAAIQMEGLGVSFKNLKDRAGVLAVTIGKGGVATAMRVFIEIAKKVISVLDTLAGSTFGKFIISAGVVSTAVFAIGSAIGLLTTKIKVLKDISIAFNMVKIGAVSASQGIGLMISSMAPVALIVAGVASLAFIIDQVRGNTIELAESSSKLADSYGVLSKKIYNYEMSLIGVEAGSKKAKEANLALRDSLLVSKNSFSELGKEMWDVIGSIDPVTGAIEKGSNAIEVYDKRLNELQLSKLSEGTNLANKSLQEQTGWLSQVGNKFADFGQMITMGRDELVKFRAKQEEVAIYADKLTKGFDKSGISFKDLGDKIASWDHTTLTSQQKEIIEGFERIDEHSTKFIDYLIKTNKVGLDDTVENFRKLAKDADLSGVALEAVVEKLTLMKKASAEGFSNRIEKWEKELKSADDTLENHIETYLKLNGVATESQKIEARAIIAEQQNFIKRMNNAKELKKQDIANGMSKAEAAEKYFATERRLLKESEETSRKASESNLIQNAKRLAKLSEDHENHLKEIALKYKNNEDLIAKYRSEAIIKFKKEEAKLLADKSIDYEIIVEDYKASLEKRKVAFSKHLDDIALLESRGVLTAKEASDKILLDKVKFATTSLELAQTTKDAIDKLEDSKSYEKANKAELKAKNELYKALMQARQGFNRDIVKSRAELNKLDEKSVAENLEYNAKILEEKAAHFEKLKTMEVNHENKILRIKESSVEKIKAIDQKIADNKKALQADLANLQASTEEKIRNIRKKSMTDAEKDASDQRAAQEMIADGIRLISEANAENDKQMLATGVAKIKNAEALASGFDKEHEALAVSILKQSLVAQQDALTTKTRIENLNKIAEKEKENAKASRKLAAEDNSYAAKVEAAKIAYDSIRSEEQIRHNTVMQNHTKEMIKDNEKTVAALKNLDSIDPTSNHIEEIKSIEGVISTLKKQLTVIESVKLANENNANALEKTTTSTKQKVDEVFESSDKVWEKSVDGVRSFTDAATVAAGELGSVFTPFEESADVSLANMTENAKTKFQELNSVVSETLSDVEFLNQDKIDAEIARFTASLNTVPEKVIDSAAKISDSVDESVNKIGEVTAGAVESISEISTAASEADVEVDVSVDPNENLVKLKQDFDTLPSKENPLESSVNVNVDGLEAVRELNDEISTEKLKRNILISIILDKLAEAISGIKALRSAILSLPEKTEILITKTIHTKYTSSGTPSGGGGDSTVTKAAVGARIPGYGGGDKVRALLEPGEWVIRKEAVKKYGNAFMSKLNAGILNGVQRFKIGGLVGGGLNDGKRSILSEEEIKRYKELQELAYELNKRANNMELGFFGGGSKIFRDDYQSYGFGTADIDKLTEYMQSWPNSSFYKSNPKGEASFLENTAEILSKYKELGGPSVHTGLFEKSKRNKDGSRLQTGEQRLAEMMASTFGNIKVTTQSSLAAQYIQEAKDAPIKYFEGLKQALSSGITFPSGDDVRVPELDNLSRTDGTETIGIGSIIQKFKTGGEVMSDAFYGASDTMKNAIGSFTLPSIDSKIPAFVGGGETPKSAVVKHSIDFSFGDKTYGPFTSSSDTCKSFIHELEKAKMRA